MFDHVPAEKKNCKSKVYGPLSQQVKKRSPWFRLVAMAWFMVFFSTLGPVLLWVSVSGIIDLVKEYRTIARLEQHGVVQTVPLIKLGTNGETIFQPHSQVNINRIYTAHYKFKGETREQNITQDQHDQLWGADRVEILVDGTTTRIKGSKPDYSVILLAVLLIPAGVVLSRISFLVDRAIVRSIRKKYQDYKKRKRDKRKRGLPEV